MTSGVFLLVAIGQLSKQTVWILSLSIVFKYLTVYNMNSQTMLIIDEINQFEHHTNHNAKCKAYEL